jgi:hypothetical protein
VRSQRVWVEGWCIQPWSFRVRTLQRGATWRSSGATLRSFDAKVAARLHWQAVAPKPRPTNVCQGCLRAPIVQANVELCAAEPSSAQQRIPKVYATSQQLLIT